jgi:multidrug efflux system membrane fusion protein
VKRKVIRAVAITASITALLLVACKDSAVPDKSPVPVRTSMVQNIAVGNSVRYSASIVPYSQVDLAFQSSGYIDHVLQVKSASGGFRNIDQGDFVRKGTVLAVVREQSYRDKLQQANAQLSRAQAEYEKAKLSFDRVFALYQTQSATKPDFDSAQAQLDSTTAAVSGAKADVSEATTALGYCSLLAPFSGWILKRTVDVGSFVGPVTNGFTIANTETVKAVFGLPDTAIDLVKLGQSLNISNDALTRQFAGKVTAISAAADPKSRVFSVEVTIPNPKNELKSGMIASLAIQGEPLPQSVLAVPLSAVVRDPRRSDGFAVMIAQGDSEFESVRLRPVALGNVYGNVIAASSGIQSGERVVTTGVSLLKDGDAVRVIP